jgi:hypothetical protein
VGENRRRSERFEMIETRPGLRHSRAAQDHAQWNNRDLKRDIEHGVRNGLHFEPARMSDELRPTILPNWKIKRAAVPFLWHTASFQLP